MFSMVFVSVGSLVMKLHQMVIVYELLDTSSHASLEMSTLKGYIREVCRLLEVTYPDIREVLGINFLAGVV